jgi:hypothetical protein
MARAVIELPDRGIVAGFDSDEKLSVRIDGRMITQQLLKHSRGELAAAAAAMSEAGEANVLYVHARAPKNDEAAYIVEDRQRLHKRRCLGDQRDPIGEPCVKQIKQCQLAGLDRSLRSWPKKFITFSMRKKPWCRLRSHIPQSAVGNSGEVLTSLRRRGQPPLPPET